MSMTRSLNRTAAVAAATVVATAAPGAILTGPAVAKPHRHTVAAQTHRRQHTTKHDRQLHVLRVRKTPHGSPQP